jgi:mannosyltransferase
MSERRVLVGKRGALAQTLLHAWRNVGADRRFATIAWLTITAYAGCVSLAFINVRSVWLDEAISVDISSQPLGGMAEILHHVDAVHGLFYLLLHAWLYLGHSAGVIRTISLVFAILASVAVGTLAKLMFDESEAPAAVAVLATSVLFLYYADEARPAALSLLTCSLAALHTWRAVTHEHRRDVVLTGLFATLAIYANFVAVLFVIALAVSVAVTRIGRRTKLLFIGVGAFAVAATVPLVALIHENTLDQIGWIAPSPPRYVAYFIADVLGGSGGTGRVGHWSGIFEAACLTALMAVAIAGAHHRHRTRGNVLIASIWFAVPLVLAIAVDRFVHPILVPRYFIFELIPAALLGGRGLTLIRRAAPPVFAIVIIALLGAVSLHSLLTVQRSDWRTATRLLVLDASPRDAIVFRAPISMAPFAYAVRELGKTPQAAVAYPSDPLINAVDYPPPRAGFVRALSRRFDKVWLIEDFETTTGKHASPFDDLARYYPHAGRRFFTKIEIVTYSR